MMLNSDAREDNNWYIYILCCNDGSLYTGICRDIRRRLHEHNNLKSGARYTRARRPVELVYLETAPSRSSAARREYRIKQLSALQKHSLIQQQRDNETNVCPDTSTS